jgi:hypothetical protein
MAARYRERYGAVWGEFVEWAQGKPMQENDGSLRYVYPLAPSGKKSHTITTAANRIHVARSSETGRAEGVAASYRYSRLCFKADVIEPLQDDEVFEVVTPVGRFQMTKSEFYESFPNVVATSSYRVGRIYHFPKVPAAAMRYRIADQ